MQKLFYYVILGILSCLVLLSCQEFKPDIPPEFVDESFWVRNAGADLFVSARGNPDSQVIIINVHGGPVIGGQRTYLSRPLAYELMENEGIIVYYDQRAIGLSTGSFSEDKISLEQFVDDLDKIVEVSQHKFGPDKNIFLLCRSWGGMLGAKYLLNNVRQHKISGWVDVNGAHDFKMMKENIQRRLFEVADEQIALNNSTNAWEKIKDQGASYDSQTNSFQEFSSFLNYAVAGMELLKQDGFIQEQYTITGLEDHQINGHSAYSGFEVSWNDAQGIADLIQSPLINYAHTEQFTQITIPTLFIWGEYDLIVPKILAESAFQTIGTSDEHKFLRIYEQGGHISSISAPVRFAQDIITFIQNH